MRKVLVIGYGNTMRSDDAAGVHAAHRLEAMFRDYPEIRVIAAHQLTPEMAEDIADTQCVLFVDAAATGAPGQIVQTRLAPGGVLGVLGHHVTPAVLLSCAEQLYGEAPFAISLTISGAFFSAGTNLSSAVAGRVDEFVARAAALVESWTGCAGLPHVPSARSALG